MRIGIMGAGGIGSVVGGLLSEAGHDITLIDQWWEQIEKIKGEVVYTVREAKKLLESGTKVALFVYVQGFYRYMALEVE